MNTDKLDLIVTILENLSSAKSEEEVNTIINGYLELINLILPVAAAKVLHSYKIAILGGAKILYKNKTKIKMLILLLKDMHDDMKDDTLALVESVSSTMDSINVDLSNNEEAMVLARDLDKSILTFSKYLKGASEGDQL